MSYLTPDKRPVGHTLTPKRARTGYQKENLARLGWIPRSKWLLPWFDLRYVPVDKSIVFVTEGLGSQPFQGRTVLLVNQHSTGASEMMAAFVSENKLAPIVGTPTAGRLVGSEHYRLLYGDQLILPVAAYITWQGRIIHGKGITPDHRVDLSYEALRKGRDNQLEKAIEVAKAL